MRLSVALRTMISTYHSRSVANISLEADPKNVILTRCLTTNRLLAIRKMSQRTGSIGIPKERLFQMLDSFVEEGKKVDMQQELFAPYKMACITPFENSVPEFLSAMNYWLQLDDEKLKFSQQMAFDMYEAIVFTDDYMDGSELRRNIPTIPQVYGGERAIYASISVILLNISKLNNTELIKTICNDFINIYSVTIAHVQHNESGICPTREEYFKIAYGKTGLFLKIFMDIIESFSSCKKDFSRFCGLLGIYTQIQGDTTNCFQDEFNCAKIFAEDILNGIFNFPIVLAAEKKSVESDVILNIVRQKPKSVHTRKYCIDLMMKIGVMEEARRIEYEFHDLMLEEIEKLGGNSDMVKILNKVRRWRSDEIFPTDPEYEAKLAFGN